MAAVATVANAIDAPAMRSKRMTPPGVRGSAGMTWDNPYSVAVRGAPIDRNLIESSWTASRPRRPPSYIVLVDFVPDRMRRAFQCLALLAFAVAPHRSSAQRVLRGTVLDSTRSIG